MDRESPAALRWVLNRTVKSPDMESSRAGTCMIGSRLCAPKPPRNPHVPLTYIGHRGTIQPYEDDHTDS